MQDAKVFVAINPYAAHINDQVILAPQELVLHRKTYRESAVEHFTQEGI